ncbi:hypothetical protein WG904_12945 [Pedobacter sp. Du54]|uniref:hypothetical protein n=1 Tax=Pedobacter anseongensis TaxID=3133439 RepID=UPI00309C8EB1
MRQKLIILIAFLSVSLYANAQEYRVAKSSGTLKLNLTSVIVEGYDGKEIVFSGQKVVDEETTDERAKGLVPISSSKYVDNTGLGISVTENGQDLNVNLVAKKPIGMLTVKVPNNIKVSIISNNNGLFYTYTSAISTTHSSTDSSLNPEVKTKTANDILIRNLKGEIEVSVYANKVRLENNTGPMSIKTVSGPIEAVFSGEIKGPVSIISATNYVDVTLPSTTKANIEMSSNFGKLYAGKEFKIDLDKVDEKSVYSISTNGERYATRLSGLASIRGENATSVSGIQTRTKGKIAATAKPKTDEVVVSGYGTNVIASKNEKVKDTLSAITVNGIQINGNGNIASTTGVNGQVITGPIYLNADNLGNFPGRVSYNAIFSSGDRIKGKLNGGGVDLIFKSTNKNVYLRQQ